MSDEQKKKPYYTKWWFWGIVVLILIVIGSVGGEEKNKEMQQTTQNQEEQSSVEIPQYSVLDKIEHISTRMSDNQASYFGGILIEEDIAEIPPEEFTEIAREIAKRENLDNSASFYSTEEAYRADYSVYVPEENRVQIEQSGGLESNQEYKPQIEIDRLLSEGYIGNFKDGEFTMSRSSTYFERHRGDSNEEND